MLELYIFNKENQSKNGLSRWDHSDSVPLTNSISFNLDRFKAKDTTDNISTELVGAMNRLYKETDGLQEYFDGLNGQLDIEFVDDYHHLLIYDSTIDRLILDSKTISQLMPIYLWAFYYSLSRQTKVEDQIYQQMFEFFACFDFRQVDSAIKLLERDSSLDAGGHLLDYLKLVLKGNTQGQEVDGYLATQLLRNRALAGKLPYDLKEFEAILNKYSEEPFAGEACQEYFDSFNKSFDEEYAKLYYKHLLKSLKQIGLQVIAQRGSRVAHEQGPILVNSTNIGINENLDLALRKARSSTIEIISKLEDAANKFFKLSADFSDSKDRAELKSNFAAKLLNLNLDLDTLMYLAKSNCPKARFLKAIGEFRTNSSDYISVLLDQARFYGKKDTCVNFYDAVRIQEKNLLSIIFDLEELIDASPQNKANAVVYVQRPSSRSGHFIPRILLGQKLYIETDRESERHRLDGIPYNFVSPDFDLVASGLDSFFENASISVVTDRQSGKPDIKWENAEDLAISLAPGMYKAIKAAQDQGKRFHYQLETTLLGPLIEIFLAILENEISNVASIELDNQYKQGLSLDNLFSVEDAEVKNPALEKILNSYQAQVNEAADFCFKYYLLEDEVQSYMLQEGLGREAASLELLLNLSDVQKDVAKYCLLKSTQQDLFEEFKVWAGNLIANESVGAKETADKISQELNQYIDNVQAKIFVKKYIRYPESTARKEYLAANPGLNRINITSNKKIADADYYFDLTVAPSRIDFGKHVVASITTIMGRMLGADDPEALIKGKEYIDYVSQTQNSLFESAAEAGSVKVIENTCRAIQYSKAISFQGVFQSFAIDGALARMTINARNDKASGLHVMEYGTMASTGYCITKEPLFILLGLAIQSDTLFDYLGVETDEARAELRDIMNELLELRTSFDSNLDWQMHVYQEMAESKSIQKYLANPDYKWLPNLKSTMALFKYLADYGTEDEMMARSYSQLASKLIEYSRIINETGIIQRIQLMNSAIKRADHKKEYKDLVIALNASYKGNVSDERENANQYLMALILHQKQYIKNTSITELDKLVDYQIKNYDLPKELRILDPLVDPQTFMGGELEARAEAAIQKISTFELDPPLTREVIEACVISYGSDYRNWRILNKRLKTAKNPSEIETSLDLMSADIKYLETYSKGFYKDPLIGYQGVDVIQLNSDHDVLITLMDDLVQLKTIMQTNNPDSLLVLIDNPQQAKRPLLDYDKALEWMALGGVVSSHLIAEEVYQRWNHEINESKTWAKAYIQKLIYQEQLNDEERAGHEAYQEIKVESDAWLNKFKEHADLKRDLIFQKYKEAQEIGVSHKTLKRYSEWILALSRINSHKGELNFNDWLILGGRWVLNGQAKNDIQYVVKLFDKSSALKNLGKHSFELMDLFISEAKLLELEAKTRLLENAGSTKEADLLVSSAGDSLEYRAQLSKSNRGLVLRMHEYAQCQVEAGANLERLWDKLLLDYIDKLKSNAATEDLNLIFGRMLKALTTYAQSLGNPELNQIAEVFVRVNDADPLDLVPVFGDHRKHGGIFRRLTAETEDLAPLSKLAEMFIVSYLLMLTIGVEDENEVINKLAIFFDQYLNVHEEDYPPYVFHSLCAGASYGFNQDYYLEPNLRTKMFKLAAKSGMDVYKLVHYLISQKSVLKQSSQEYRDSLIGDYENGIIAIGYQHDHICIEERFWDCMRALRNFVRNYHDRHPLPIVLRGSDATVSKLFRYKLEPDCQLNWIAGLANIGKHSWDLNCVFRSPLLRDRIKRAGQTKYINISIFAPFLTTKGEIKQIYTAFRPELIEEQKLCYLAPYADASYKLNDEGFVHALVNLEGEISLPSDSENTSMKDLPLVLPKPNLTMSAHTHPQYLEGLTLKLGIPEVWSILSMKQMYAKTELPKILKYANLPGLVQLDFMHKEFETKKELAIGLEDKLKTATCEHIDNWLLKASRDSGGRGISGKLSLSKDRAEMIDFIFEKTRTDDLVMQEFVPNNARAFILPEFLTRIEEAFVEEGLAIERTTPFEQMYFAMRSFQSTSGIKGYLFSANIGAVTVNAGQGAKMFYGEPSYIMPLYIAGKIQKLMDEQGEIILKQAIPQHAIEFAKENNIVLVDNQSGGNNCFMLNGLFDYIPYVYVMREGRRYILDCKDNAQGGISYSYNYQDEQITLLTAINQKASLDQLEQLLKASANKEYQGPEELIDIDLAKIELNSGLGQANLLQKAVEEMAPENRDVFLEWTEDLGEISSRLLAKN